MIGLRSRGTSWAPWGASVRFAGRVAARYAHGPLWRGGVGRVALRAARGVGRVATRHEWRGVRLELRVRVEGAGADGRRPMVGAWGPPPLSIYGRSSNPLSSIQLTANHRVASPGRIERVPAGLRESSSTPAASYARPFPTVPRILRRGASNDAETAADSRDLAFRRPDRSAPSVRASVAAQGTPFTTFTPPELDRLTTQVVDAIDRRLAAYRERHGRG